MISSNPNVMVMTQMLLWTGWTSFFNYLQCHNMIDPQISAVLSWPMKAGTYNGFIFFHIISWSLGAGTSLEENAALLKKKVSYLLCISYIFSSKLANDATSIIKMHNIFWETSYCQSWLVKLNGLVKINIVFCLCHIGFIWTQYVLWK